MKLHKLMEALASCVVCSCVDTWGTGVLFCLPYSAALANICFLPFISESLWSLPEVVLSAPVLNCHGSCDRMWAVRAPQSTPESGWRVLEHWLILHGAKGIQESVNTLSLLCPSKFPPVLSGEESGQGWWLQWAQVVPLAPTCVNSPSRSSGAEPGAVPCVPAA